MGNISKDGEQIANYLSQYTDKAKSMARTIIIAIIGTGWSMSYNAGTFSPSNEIKYAILCCAIYLFLDVLSYFLITITFKLILTRQFEIEAGGFVYKEGKKAVGKTTRYIHEISFVVFVVMFIVLLFASGFLIDHILALPTIQ